jgi:hypothetical protein
MKKQQRNTRRQTAVAELAPIGLTQQQLARVTGGCTAIEYGQAAEGTDSHGGGLVGSADGAP